VSTAPTPSTPETPPTQHNPPHQRHHRDLMTAFLADARDVLVPGRTDRHGPLPPLLVSMTLVTGLVDAFSYLVLGHVFVANMTGNVVFLGFALAGAPGFSITASLTAVAFFAVGALLGGRLGSRHRAHRARLHSSAAAAQAAFLAAAVILAVVGGSTLAAGYRYTLIAALGICMGIQNAAARTIAVPDLTTTVLTLTITGIAADSPLAGRAGSKAGRRLVPVVAMLVGALLGAALIRHAQAYDPLAIALATIAAGAATSYLLGRSDPAWVRPQG
jgi:uncharacterized membrane protein YoaK (UPF0700 family)